MRGNAAPLARTIVVVSDLVEGHMPHDWVIEPEPGFPAPVDSDALRPGLEVTGGYLERLPLACMLEGGAWAAGRALAEERRGGLPPMTIDSDGTVF